MSKPTPRTQIRIGLPYETLGEFLDGHELERVLAYCADRMATTTACWANARRLELRTIEQRHEDTHHRNRAQIHKLQAALSLSEAKVAAFEGEKVVAELLRQVDGMEQIRERDRQYIRRLNTQHHARTNQLKAQIEASDKQAHEYREERDAAVRELEALKQQLSTQKDATE